MTLLSKSQKEVIQTLESGGLIEGKERTLKSLKTKGAIKNLALFKVEFLGDFTLRYYSAEVVK